MKIEAAESLTENSATEILADSDRVTKTAAHLAVVEIALGSVVHGLKLPFAGHTLSLNQGFFLCQALDPAQSRVPMARQSFEISSITSLLKSLSPAGNKIGPMLSIAMQGFLFSVGLLVSGTGLGGQIFGMLLLSLWAFVQPFLTLFVIHGFVLGTIAEFYWKRLETEIPWLADSLVLVLIVAILTKLLIAVLIPFLVRFSKPGQIESFQQKLTQKLHSQSFDSDRKSRTVFKGVIFDLTRPLFVFSMVLLVTFFFLTESSFVRIFWMSLRPLAIAVVIFYLVRSTWFLNQLKKIAGRNLFFQKMLNQTNKVYAAIHSNSNVQPNFQKAHETRLSKANDEK